VLEILLIRPCHKSNLGHATPAISPPAGAVISLAASPGPSFQSNGSLGLSPRLRFDGRRRRDEDVPVATASNWPCAFCLTFEQVLPRRRSHVLACTSTSFGRTVYATSGFRHVISGLGHVGEWSKAGGLVASATSTFNIGSNGGVEAGDAILIAG
jgi:hypothetical protein